MLKGEFSLITKLYNQIKLIRIWLFQILIIIKLCFNFSQQEQSRFIFQLIPKLHLLIVINISFLIRRECPAHQTKLKIQIHVQKINGIN
jgi:hypothetical protein